MAEYSAFIFTVYDDLTTERCIFFQQLSGVFNIKLFICCFGAGISCVYTFEFSRLGLVYSAEVLVILFRIFRLVLVYNAGALVILFRVFRLVLV